jgi:hypothetical protein
MPFDPYYGNSSDEELLALGRASGVLPTGPESEPQESYYDMEEPGEVRQDFRTWVPQQLGYEPAYETPAPTPTAPAPAPESTGSSTSVGVSQSHRGFSPSKWAEVSETDKELNADLAASEQDAQNREDRMVAPQVMAAESNVLAEKARAEAEIQGIRAKGEQALVMQRLQDEFAVEEAKANAEAQAMANKSKLDYMEALADFRASRVDPAQLWGHMTGGERFGTLVTAFVHDFLGAKGINTSAMATFNKAVDRNIDAQVMAIKTKGEVAEGFKSLWWMQRNQSASDAEARARVRGFLLEGTKQAVIANMTKYEAGLASAQGQKALAEIDAELAKNLVEIYKHSDDNALSLRNQAITKWQTKLQNSMESWANAIRAKEAETSRRRQQKEEKPEAMRLIHDPETGEAVGYFQPGVGDKEQEKATELFIDAKVTSDSMNQLRELVRNSKPVIDPLGGTRFQNTDQQKFDALSTKLAHQMVKAMGERATEPDVQQMLKAMRPNSYMNMADAEKVIAFMQANVLAPAQAAYSGYAYDLPEGSPLRQIKAGKSTSILNQARTEAHFTAEPPPPTQNEKDRQKAIEGISGPQGRQPYNGENSELSKAHKKALEFDPSLFAPDETVKVDGPGGYTMAEGKKKRPVYQFERNMVELRRLARNGDTKARDHLVNLAVPYLNNLPGKDDESAFAALMLSTMDE